MRQAVLIGATLILVACEDPHGTNPSPALLAGLPTDITPPSLSSLTLSPTSVNTSDALAQVNVDFTVTDDISGVTHVRIYFANPSGTVLVSVISSFPPSTSLAASSVLSIPQYSESGIWHVYVIEAADDAGNRLVLTEQDAAALGFPTTIDVFSAIQDLGPPTLTALSFSPATVNTATGPAAVTIHFTATDDLAGVSGIFVGFCGPSGSVSGFTGFAPAASVSDSFAITFPRFTEAGAWTICGVDVRDAASNRHGFNSQDLTDMGFATTLLVLDAMPVAIDIRPGGVVNAIRPDKPGKVTVAILSDGGFDAMSEVIPTSLLFGRTGEETSLASCARNGEDANGDGYTDLICRFHAQRTGFQLGDTEGILRGRTVDQIPIEGRDVVLILK